MRGFNEMKHILLENQHLTAREIADKLRVPPKRVHTAAHYYGIKLKRHELTCATYAAYGQAAYRRKKEGKQYRVGRPSVGK